MDTIANRATIKKLWETDETFQCFQWETVKRVASNPNVKTFEDLHQAIGKIANNLKTQ